MAKINVSLVNGSVFEYDDSLKELYRMTNPDGTTLLKLEGCPEIHLTKDAPVVKRNTVYDSYLIMAMDPALFTSKINLVLKGLRINFPYFDAYIRPAVEGNMADSNIDEDLLYDDEYNCQSFFLFLTAEPIMTPQVKYFVDNLLGSLSKEDINGYLDNAMCQSVFDTEIPVVFDVACITTNERIANRTFSAGCHQDMAVNTATRDALVYANPQKGKRSQ